MARIGILVVAYNAETTLRHVLQRIPSEIVDKLEEIFVFDDASQDHTYEVGLACKRESFGSKLTVVRNQKNLMYGGNQRAGYSVSLSLVDLTSSSCCMATDSTRQRSCKTSSG